MVDESTVVESVKAALLEALGGYSKALRAEVEAEFDDSSDSSDHSDCYKQEDLDGVTATAEVATELPWAILELMGVDRRLVEGVECSHPLDILRYLRGSAEFVAFVRREAELADRVGLSGPAQFDQAVELARSVFAKAVTNGVGKTTIIELPAEHHDFETDDDSDEPPPIVQYQHDDFEFDDDDNDEPPPIPDIDWTDEQLRALDSVDEWYRCGDEPFFSLMGPAGSGKTTCVREAIARMGLSDPALTAMTGKAALRLAQCAGLPASTLHKVLYYPPNPGETVEFSRLRDPPGSFLLVDESSMVTPAVYEHLQHWARQGVKILLVGDAFQLPPVITGEERKKHGEDYSVFAHVTGAELSTVMRSAGGVLRAATKMRETGEIARESDEGYEYARSSSPLEDAVSAYLEDMDDHYLITWKNSVRMRANRVIRERLGHGGRLPDEGEPVLIRKNGQGYLNGEVVSAGTFTKGPVLYTMQTLWMNTGGGRILVSIGGGREGEEMDGGQPWVENWRKYHATMKSQGLPEPIPITFGYVLTAHAAQGSEARRVTVFLEREDVRNKFFRKSTVLPGGRVVSQAVRWAYTAATRSKQRTTMIVGQ